MKYYTGIGSRETPRDILKLMEDIAYKLAHQGYILRSGAASGADTAFQSGAMKYAWEQADSYSDFHSLGCIYIPWKSFARYEDYWKDWYWNLEHMGYKKEAYQLASETHPAWEKCSKGAKALHARNTFQVLGSTLNNPSTFLICWAKLDKHGNIKGGTATAWNLAKAYGVPCFNLYNKDDKQRLIKWLKREE